VIHWNRTKQVAWTEIRLKVQEHGRQCTSRSGGSHGRQKLINRVSLTLFSISAATLKGTRSVHLVLPQIFCATFPLPQVSALLFLPSLLHLSLSFCHMCCKLHVSRKQNQPCSWNQVYDPFKDILSPSEVGEALPRYYLQGFRGIGARMMKLVVLLFFCSY